MAGISLADQDLVNLFELYPADPAAGSPFDTGEANAITPQFKRLAAFQGDLFLQAPRRLFLKHTSTKQDTYAYRTLSGLHS